MSEHDEHQVPIIIGPDDPKAARVSPYGLTISTAQLAAHANSRDHGFWGEGQQDIPLKLMLIVTEAAEAMEAWREWHELVTYDDETGKPEGLPAELADIVIRCLDLAGFIECDLENVIKRKMMWNAGRPRLHGKRA